MQENIYPKKIKFLFYFLFFCLGIMNHLGTILVQTGARLLAKELDMEKYLYFYTTSCTIFSSIMRVLNSRFFIKVPYKKRVIALSIFMIFGYLSMYIVLKLHKSKLENENALCFLLSLIPSCLLGASYAFGENAILAYLKLFPKEYLGGWSSGTGLSGLTGASLNLSSQLIKNFGVVNLYLYLTPLGIIYFLFFFFTEKLKECYINNDDYRTFLLNNENKNITLTDEKNKDETVNKINNETNNEENSNENEEENKNTENETNKEEMKEVKEMNMENFKYVMKICGDIIINLCLIYFLQFFAANALLIVCVRRIDISFLPKDEDNHRKAKYEFLLMFFQIGMFIAKSLLFIAKKIQPIYIYTVVLLFVNLFLIFQYYLVIFQYYLLIPILMINGFFGGGSYAGGFYAILNNDKLGSKYKDLTVNIATIFDDIGTILSGLFGFINQKLIMTADDLKV
jgi:hypothetical protein